MWVVRRAVPKAVSSAGLMAAYLADPMVDLMVAWRVDLMADQ